MSLTIGRAGIDITLDDPQSITVDGDTITLTLDEQACSSVADFAALRQQLNGLVDNSDEPFVPVTWTEDSSLDGYYKVHSVNMGSNEAMLANWVFPWSIQLERLTQAAQPMFELVSIGAVRANSAAITEVNFNPPTTGAYDFTAASDTTWIVAGGDDGQALFLVNTGSIATADGSMRFISGQATNVAPYATQFLLPPASWYLHGVKLEVSRDSGVTWRTAVGRQIPNVPSYWRISNGLLRVSFTNSAGCDINIETYDGTQWDTAKQFTIGIASTTSLAGTVPRSIHVLRNDPFMVSIRIVCTPLGTLSGPFVLDIALRRGSHIASFLSRLQQGTSAFAYLVQRSSVEAATALTGGIRATANDAQGNRYVLSSPESYTPDLVNGKLSVAASSTGFRFGIGTETNGSGAATIFAAQQIVYQYHSARNHIVRAVGR